MFSRTFDSMARTIGQIHHYNRASRRMAALGRMDPRTLQDIGVEPSSIPSIAMELAARPRGAKMRRAA
jgi:uncharacterized protein YjiS (DUF1127 family)